MQLIARFEVEVLVQPDLSPTLRREVNAALAEVRAVTVVAAAAGVSPSTVTRAFRPPLDPDAVPASGGLLLTTLVELASMGRPDLVARVFRAAGLPCQIVPEPIATEPASCGAVQREALEATAALGRLAAYLSQATEDGRLDPHEVRELQRLRGDLLAHATEIGRLIDGAAGNPHA